MKFCGRGEKKKSGATRCHMEVRSRARLQRRRGDVEAQHVSPLACSCGWKNDIITDDPYSYR